VPRPADERKAVGASPALHNPTGQHVAVRPSDAKMVEEGKKPIPPCEGHFAVREVRSHHTVQGPLPLRGGGGELGHLDGVVSTTGHTRNIAEKPPVQPMPMPWWG
jgi:hypothetical protein